MGAHKEVIEVSSTHNSIGKSVESNSGINKGINEGKINIIKTMTIKIMEEETIIDPIDITKTDS